MTSTWVYKMMAVSVNHEELITIGSIDFSSFSTLLVPFLISFSYEQLIIANNIPINIQFSVMDLKYDQFLMVSLVKTLFFSSAQACQIFSNKGLSPEEYLILSTR